LADSTIARLKAVPKNTLLTCNHLVAYYLGHG
jgi:hypothetical protein